MSLFSRRQFLVTTAAAGVMVHPFTARATEGQAHLRLLCTTDIHCHIRPYDYYADKPVDTVGLSRTAKLIEGVRAEAANTMIFDNGDYMQGNPMADYIAYSRGMKEGDTHPVIAAMNLLGYDCGTLGNHEFNYGMAFLDKVNARANFPLVCANFAHTLGASPREDDLYLRPYLILERDLADGAGNRMPIRIGVTGFVPPQIMQWDRAHLEGRFNTRDIVEAAQAWVPQMREEGADLVVALAHTGIDAGTRSDGMENAALYLAGVEGVDVVITGHQHRNFPGKDFAGPGIDNDTGTLMGKPAVQAGFWGNHMGLIDLMLERPDGKWRITTHISEIRPIFRRKADRSVVALTGDYAPVLTSSDAADRETLKYVRARVGETTAPLYSYFALVADDPSVQIVSNAQLWYTKKILEGTPAGKLPLLSAAAPFKAGGRGGPDYYTDVPKGPVAIRNVADLYLYPNTLQVVKVTGAQVKAWLERSAGIFNQIRKGARDAPLLNPDFPSYNFDVIDGVTYRIDITRPSRYDTGGNVANADANRIVDLACQGEPIDPEAEFVIATNNYRAGGGGHFPGADGSSVIYQAPDTNRDVIVRYIHEEGTISPQADANWSFAPAGGATVIFETGPKGQPYLEDVKTRGLRIETAGPGEGGFEKYRITL